MSCKISYRIGNTKKSHEPLKAPCQYNEYKLVGEPEESKNPDGERTIELALSDTMMTSVKEEKLYGFLTFLAEFGGALGLFVGWSLLSVFDLVDVIRNAWREWKK